MPPAAKKVREYADRRGYDLSDHRAEMVEPLDVEWADLVLYMDQQNLDALRKFSLPRHEAKLRCLASYIGKDKLPDPGFVSRGPQLEKLLAWVHQAAEACTRELTAESTKKPRG